VRLHSDFQDYYDNAIGYGVDDKVHYNRYQKKVSINLKSHLNRPFHRNSGLLGFCGRTYPFIELHRYDRNFEEEDHWGEFNIVETRFAFSEHDYLETEREWSDFSDEFHSYLYQSDLKIRQFFLDWVQNSDEIFLEYKVPIWAANFYVEEPNGVLNPRLREFGFEKIKDPFAAFQEISMYLANILVEQKEISVIEDKYRIEQHGFDLKESFRNTKKRKER
jgi:hypothetical protein